MQTREQVIAGLNDIHAVACGLGDDECYLNSIGIKQLQTLINDATELLKAQEPIKPLKRAVDYVRKEPVVFSYECPVCMRGLQRHWVACPTCGQAVKWA